MHFVFKAPKGKAYLVEMSSNLSSLIYFSFPIYIGYPSRLLIQETYRVNIKFYAMLIFSNKAVLPCLRAQ